MGGEGVVSRLAFGRNKFTSLGEMLDQDVGRAGNVIAELREAVPGRAFRGAGRL